MDTLDRLTTWRRWRPGDGILAVALAGDSVVGYAFALLRRDADDTFEYAGDGYAEFVGDDAAVRFHRRRGYAPSEELFRRSITAGR